VKFARVASLLFNQPLAVLPEKAAVLAAVVAPRFEAGPLTINGRLVSPSSSTELGEIEEMIGRAPAPYDVVEGVAIIPVWGTLVQRTGAVAPVSGITGYDSIRSAFLAALDDSAVRAIALDIDSPGGSVAGCFDLVDTIYGMRGQKPVVAILSENAYSAAYAIASAADLITVPRTGGTGSVGVICMHVDFSKALEQAGIAVTLITYGSRKAEGNEFSPLSDGALARFQADVDKMGALFCETVARNRGISVAAVTATEASTFLGAAGVELGLADAVMAPDEAFKALLAELG
jgi:signal peptide peptidase SppA